MYNMAMAHGHGKGGLPVDQARCIELLQYSAGLGYPRANYQLGAYHHADLMGLERNGDQAFEYWEEAAKGGDVRARHNLALFVGPGNAVTAMRHWRLAASAGDRLAMDHIIVNCFEGGFLRHGDLAEILQVMYRSRAETRSEDRDLYIMDLKMKAKYDESHDDY